MHEKGDRGGWMGGLLFHLGYISYIPFSFLIPECGGDCEEWGVNQFQMMQGKT